MPHQNLTKPNSTASPQLIETQQSLTQLDSTAKTLHSPTDPNRPKLSLTQPPKLYTTRQDITGHNVTALP